MKKIVFWIFCMVGSVSIVTAQERLLKVDTVPPLQQLCAPIPLTHWSLGLKAGVSDFLIPPNAINESDRLKLMVGGLLEYTINPLIGIGLEYDYNDYSRPYTYQGINGKLKGLTNDVILYGSVNLSNALVPVRSGFWQTLNIYGDVGAGVGFYQFALDNAKTKYREAMMGKLGLNAEISLSESFNLSIEGQRNQYDSRNMSDARATGNCDAWIFTVGLRYKIGSSSSKHARNISLCEYSAEPAPIVIAKTYMKGDTDELLNRVEVAERENAATKIELQRVKDNVK